MSEINLLPTEMKPKGYVVDLANSLKKFAVIALFVFLVGALSLTGVYIYFLRGTRASVSEHEGLKSQIKALQATEQRLILVKDRLSKVEDVFESDDAEEEILAFERVSSFANEGILVEDVDIKAENLEVSLTAVSLTNLTEFIGNLVRLGGFETIILRSLEFDPDSGYLVIFSLN